MESPSRYTTINNFTISHARSIASKHFGKHVDKVAHGDKLFDVYIYDTADKKELDRFQELYEKEFNLIVVVATPYKKLKSSK